MVLPTVASISMYPLHRLTIRRVTPTDFIVVEALDDVGKVVVPCDDGHLEGVLVGVVLNRSIGAAKQQHARARLLKHEKLMRVYRCMHDRLCRLMTYMHL